MKNVILRLLLYTHFLIFLSSCSQENDLNIESEPEIETGVYVGFLGNMPSLGDNSLDFKIEVSKIGERKYSIRQVSPGALPTFYFTVNVATTADDIQLEQSGYYKGTIPPQTSGTVTIIGDGIPNGEEDCGFYAPQKRLTFMIQINSSGYRAGFSGVKE